MDEAHLADQEAFDGQTAREVDALQQLRVHLTGKPTLADEILRTWLGMIQVDEALGLRQEAEEWYDLMLLSGSMAQQSAPAYAQVLDPPSSPAA